jgi:hypothetical protein
MTKALSWIITLGALWFVFVGVDWSRVTFSDWPFLNAFFEFNKGGMQILVSTLLFVASGACLILHLTKPAITLFLLGVLYAAYSGMTPFQPCDRLNPAVRCSELVDRAARH